MNAQTKRAAVVTGVLTLVFLAGFVISTLFKTMEIKKLGTLLEEARLKTEMQLSEKLEKEKEVLSSNNSLTDLRNRYTSVSAQFEEANKELAEQQHIVADAKNKQHTLNLLKKHVGELAQQKDELERKINELSKENIALSNKQNDLSTSVATLSEENRKLKESNELMGSMLTNNVLVEAFKGQKEKLTVKARRTGRVQTSFDLSQDMTENLSFKITGPNGKVYKNGEKNVVTYSLEDSPSKVLLASLDKDGGVRMKSIKRVKLIFKPTGKLAAGTYLITVMNKETEVGKMQVRLR